MKQGDLEKHIIPHVFIEDFERNSIIAYLDKIHKNPIWKTDLYPPKGETNEWTQLYFIAINHAQNVQNIQTLETKIFAKGFPFPICYCCLADIIFHFGNKNSNISFRVLEMLWNFFTHTVFDKGLKENSIRDYYLYILKEGHPFPKTWFDSKWKCKDYMIKASLVKMINDTECLDVEVWNKFREKYNLKFIIDLFYFELARGTLNHKVFQYLNCNSFLLQEFESDFGNVTCLYKQLTSEDNPMDYKVNNFTNEPFSKWIYYLTRIVFPVNALIDVLFLILRHFDNEKNPQTRSEMLMEFIEGFLKCKFDQMNSRFLFWPCIKRRITSILEWYDDNKGSIVNREIKSNDFLCSVKELKTCWEEWRCKMNVYLNKEMSLLG